MLAYAAPRPGREAARPTTLLVIVAGHVLAISAVMLARSDIPGRFKDPPIIVTPIPIPDDPPPHSEPKHRRTDPVPSRPTVIDPIVKVDPVQQPDTAFDMNPVGPVSGSGTDLGPVEQPPLQPPHEIVRRDARMMTSEELLRPPYPDSKRILGEEAALRLRLSIDERGRVMAVEPVGKADPAFLDSARRHLIHVWRFAPATEDGHAVPSSRVITLRFELGEG